MVIVGASTLLAILSIYACDSSNSNTVKILVSRHSQCAHTTLFKLYFHAYSIHHPHIQIQILFPPLSNGF